MDKNIKLNIVLLTLISVCAAVAVYASYIGTHLTGPTSITTTIKGDVIVALHDKFVRLDASGVINQQKTFNQLGISGPVEDMQALSDGQLIVGDGGLRKLLSCNELLTMCDKLSSDTNPYDVGQFHKFYVDEQASRILLTNTEKHELVALDLKGNWVNTLIDKTRELKFPSGLYYLGDDKLMITSSLKQHIYQYDISGDKAKKTRLINVDAVAIHGEKYLPINLSRTDNNHWWVVAQDYQLIGSRLLEYDENWKFQRVIGASEMLHPYDILSLGKWLLVTDLHGVDLFAYNLQGELLNKFGEQAFYRELKNALNIKQASEVAKHTSIVLILVLLIVALVLEQRRKKNLKKKVDSENEVIREENINKLVFEIHTKTSYLKLLRLMPVVMLIVLSIPLIFLRDSSPETLSVMMFGFMPIFVIIITATSIAVRHFPKKIRVESNMLEITTYKNKQVRLPIQDIVYNNMIIWMGNDYYSLGKKGVLIELNENYYRLLKFLEQAKQEQKRKLFVKTLIVDKWLYLALVVAFIWTQSSDYFEIDSGKLEQETEIINELHSLDWPVK